MMPCVRAYCPVRKLARDGEQSGVVDEGVLKQRAFAREPIDIRRLHNRMACSAKLVPTQIVHEDEDDVGRLSDRRLRRGGERESDQEPCKQGAHGNAVW